MLAHLLTTPVRHIEEGPGQVGEFPDFLDMAVMAGLDEYEDWLRWPGFNIPPMPLRMGEHDPRRHRLGAALTEVAVYALRSATGNGEISELDPDELVRHLHIGMFGYFTENGFGTLELENPEDSGDCLDMLGEQDPNAAWMSLAHVICYEAGIPSGDLTERLQILRDILQGQRQGSNDAPLSGEVKAWDGN